MLTKPIIKLLSATMTIAVGLSQGLTTLASLPPTNTPLFILERSNNKNQVIYEMVGGQNNFLKPAPIHPFWRMLAKDGHVESLTPYENRKVYGVSVVDKKRETLKFVVKALPKYPITVAIDPKTKKPYATIHVMGQDQRLKKIFLQLGGGLTPSVESINIQSLSPQNNRINQITLSQAKNGKWKETSRSAENTSY